MKIKYLFWFLTFILGMLLITSLFKNNFNTNVSLMDSWVGEYCYEEYSPPNMGMTYLITIYEDDGLYAYIKIDGFQTLTRVKSKVWSNGDEIMFECYDYYIDEEGNSTMYEFYNSGDILLKLKKQKGALVTEWGKLKPMLTEDEEQGQYFKIEKSSTSSK